MCFAVPVAGPPTKSTKSSSNELKPGAANQHHESKMGAKVGTARDSSPQTNFLVTAAFEMMNTASAAEALQILHAFSTGFGRPDSRVSMLTAFGSTALTYSTMLGAKTFLTGPGIDHGILLSKPGACRSDRIGVSLHLISSPRGHELGATEVFCQSVVWKEGMISGIEDTCTKVDCPSSTLPYIASERRVLSSSGRC